MEYTIAVIAVVALCTLFTRALPFVIFGKKKELPELVQYLGKVLPAAIIAILVVYCLKNVSFLAGSRGIPEFAAIAVVIALHLWKRNTLLSIGAGTVVCMFLIQVVFR